jgi:formate transporter
MIDDVASDGTGGIRHPNETDLPPVQQFDALLPSAMAEKAEELGRRKAEMDPITVFVLAALAGAFIAMGAIFATVVSTGEASFGITRLLSGLVFSLGLILVVVGGAELFTGNNLIVMAWASGKVSTRKLLRNWAVVYVGNMVGSVLIAVLVFGSGQYLFANGAVGETMLSIASAKSSLGFGQAICLGILCNVLVCLAVWLAFSAHSTTDRILAVVPPVAAFVAAGFEHSVANMYFLPIGLLVKSFAPAEFWQSISSTPGDWSSLTLSATVVNNLLPVTIGNIIGGAGMVGLVYWFVYLRKRSRL